MCMGQEARALRDIRPPHARAQPWVVRTDSPTLLATTPVHERILARCRQSILKADYVITLHAADEMEADGYGVLDVERGILTGTILEVQRDRETMRCDNCGSVRARARRVTRTFGKGSDLLVIENVPVVSCSHCGESYVTADTLHELEKLRAPGGSIEKREVGVVRFDAA